jgi:hypothetical protein
VYRTSVLSVKRAFPMKVGTMGFIRAESFRIRDHGSKISPSRLVITCQFGVRLKQPPGTWRRLAVQADMRLGRILQDTNAGKRLDPPLEAQGPLGKGWHDS